MFINNSCKLENVLIDLIIIIIVNEIISKKTFIFLFLNDADRKFEI